MKMKKFMRLVNFEFERLSTFLFILLAVLTGLQLAGSVFHSRNYSTRITNLIVSQGYSTEEALSAMMGEYSHARFLNSMWFIASIAFVIVGLFFYTFFIWYREWWAKNTFAYRLLMLPLNRMSVFFSKLIALMSALATLLVTQIILVFLTEQITSSLVSADYYADLSLNRLIYGSVLTVLIPTDWMQFIYSYSIGTMVIMVIFTAILIERSTSGTRGWILSGAYGGFFLILSFGTMLINAWFPMQHEFFTSEVYWITFAVVSVFTILSLFLSHHILSKKITV